MDGNYVILATATLRGNGGIGDLGGGAYALGHRGARAERVVRLRAGEYRRSTGPAPLIPRTAKLVSRRAAGRTLRRALGL